MQKEKKNQSLIERIENIRTDLFLILFVLLLS